MTAAGATTFAARLRKARLRLAGERGIEVDQGELAEVAGVSRGAVSQWETGRTVPKDVDAYVKLARLLGVRLDWLIAGEGPMLRDADSGAVEGHQTEETPQGGVELPPPRPTRLQRSKSKDSNGNGGQAVKKVVGGIHGRRRSRE